MKTFLFHLNELIWIKSDDESVAMEGIFSGPSRFLKGVSKRVKADWKIVLTSGIFSPSFVFNDLSSTSFEIRPCLREKLRKSDI